MWPITKSYHIPIEKHETTPKYAHRCWFIAKQNPKTVTELNQAINWSLIESHMTFEKCSYSEEATDLVNRMRIQFEWRS